VVPYVNDLALVVSSPEKLHVQAVLRDCLTSHLLVVLLTEVLQICDYRILRISLLYSLCTIQQTVAPSQ